MGPDEPSAPEVARRYVSRALQGDLSDAAALFAETDPTRATDSERNLADAFRRRFGEAREDGDDAALPPFARDVVRAYHAYWRFALLHPRDAAADDTLFAGLRASLRAHGRDPGTSPDETLERTGEGLDAAGLHHIRGKTLPLWDLMVWARQDTTHYDVQLTDTVCPVDVVFVRDLRVRGWSHWATFGRASTGGWAGKRTLFCLGDDYDVDSEHFRVSYLQHEARHFADYERFPRLEQIDLEYRGKLTELAFAESTLAETIGHFARAAGASAHAPHAFANDAVVRDLSREVFGEAFVGDKARWGEAPAADVRAAARRLLERNTSALEKAGAESTRGVVRERVATR